MSASRSDTANGPPVAAFGALLRCEAKLALRTPIGLVSGIGLPLVLVVVFGEISAHAASGVPGVTVMDLYVPILLAFSIAALGLLSVPAPVVAYREQGILRRMSTTPVPPAWVLAAQMVVHLRMAVIASAAVLVASVAGFGAAAPRDVPALLLAVLLTAAALFSLGLLIAARTRQAAAAGPIGGGYFFR